MFTDLHWKAIELYHVKMLYCLTAILYELWQVTFTTKALEGRIWCNVMTNTWGFSCRSVVSQLVCNIHTYICNKALQGFVPVNLSSTVWSYFIWEKSEHRRNWLFRTSWFNCKKHQKAWEDLKVISRTSNLLCDACSKIWLEPSHSFIRCNFKLRGNKRWVMSLFNEMSCLQMLC